MSINNQKTLVNMKIQEIELQDAYLQLEMSKIDVRYQEANIELLELMQHEHTRAEFEDGLNKRKQIHQEWRELANKLSYNKNNPL
jgi:hypothetical protein